MYHIADIDIDDIAKKETYLTCSIDLQLRGWIEQLNSVKLRCKHTQVAQNMISIVQPCGIAEARGGASAFTYG